MNISILIRVFTSVIFASALLAPDCLSAKTLFTDVHKKEWSFSGKNGTKVNAENSAQTQNPAIIVGGRTLTGPNSSAQRRDGRLFLPVAIIARTLGDAVDVDAAARIITIRRQTGATADFNAESGQVRENKSVVLVVSNTAEIVFPPNAEDLMLPIEIVAGLLDVSIRFDEAAQAVIVTRGELPKAAVKTGEKHAFAELYQADYDYNLSRYASFSNQNLTLNAAGRIGDGRFSLTSNLSGSSARQLLFHSSAFSNGTFTYERASGQKFVGGDFGTGTDLQFMSSNLRGALAQMPIGSFRATAFAGRAASGVFLPTIELPEQDGLLRPDFKQSRFRYDTNVFGIYATADSSANSRFHPNSLTLSAGVMRFNGANRNGEMFAGSVRYAQRRVRLQGDIAAGKFSGIGRGDSRVVRGFGAAADFSGSFQIRDNLSVQGRYAYIGANFLSPQSGLQQPINLKAVGIAWQPKSWLSTSLNASAATRPGDAAQRDNFTTATLSLTPRNRLPTIFFSHTGSGTTQIKNASFTLLNATKIFANWRLFMNATRIKNFGAPSLNTQFGAEIRLNEANSLEVSQSFGSRGSLNGSAEWRASNLLNRRLSFNAGFGYTRGNSSSFSASGRFSASLRLPRQSSLQVSYLQTSAGPTMLISLRGTLFRKRESSIAMNAPASETSSYGAFSGRVYQDTNLNGQYDAGVDKAQEGVKVRVDGNRYVASDANGLFRIDGVKVGEHQVYLDLLSVRADLTLLDGAQQNARLIRNRDSVVDFRLVRTGRVSGIVWLDLNENGLLDKDEQPLADVRVVAADGRDTLTDANGYFVIGDFPPGEQVVLVDEKTLPEKTKSARAALPVKVSAGRETANTNFAITAIPPEIKRFIAKSNQ